MSKRNKRVILCLALFVCTPFDRHSFAYSHVPKIKTPEQSIGKGALQIKAGTDNGVTFGIDERSRRLKSGKNSKAAKTSKMSNKSEKHEKSYYEDSQYYPVPRTPVRSPTCKFSRE